MQTLAAGGPPPSPVLELARQAYAISRKLLVKETEAVLPSSLPPAPENKKPPGPEVKVEPAGEAALLSGEKRRKGLE